MFVSADAIKNHKLHLGRVWRIVYLLFWVSWHSETYLELLNCLCVILACEEYLGFPDVAHQGGLAVYRVKPHVNQVLGILHGQRKLAGLNEALATLQKDEGHMIWDETIGHMKQFNAGFNQDDCMCRKVRTTNLIIECRLGTVDHFDCSGPLQKSLVIVAWKRF